MPLYTYRCENCGEQFDQRQSFDDPPLTTCPTCGEEQLRKVYLPVGIVFKGSGFYATDHKSSSGANGTKPRKKGDNGKEETSSKKADSGTNDD